MDKKTPIEVAFNAVTYAITFADLEQVLKVVSLVLSIITSIIILISTIVRWWKKATADGKITKDEIKEGVDIIVGGVNDISDNIKKDKEEK